MQCLCGPVDISVSQDLADAVLFSIIVRHSAAVPVSIASFVSPQSMLAVVWETAGAEQVSGGATAWKALQVAACRAAAGQSAALRLARAAADAVYVSGPAAAAEACAACCAASAYDSSRICC